MPGAGGTGYVTEMMPTAEHKQSNGRGERRGIRLRDGELVLFEPAVEGLPRWTLRCLMGMPRGARERVLFGRSAASQAAHRAVQKILKGPKQAHIQFAEGPAAGYSFKCYTSEKYFLMGADYEREVRETLQRRGRPGMVAYQVGAHCGYWAILLSRICGPHGKVFAFEASPANFERLVANLRFNMTPNVTPINRAVSDRSGTVHLGEVGSGRGISAEWEDGSVPDGAALERIESVRVDDFVFREEHLPPGLLLVNAGGQAGGVLRGARETLRRIKPLVVCEIHGSKEQEEIEEEVAAQGYAMRAISNGRKYPRQVLCEPRSGPRITPSENALLAPPAVLRRRFLQQSFQCV